MDTEVYTDFLDVVVNAKLRNAIGHNDVEYDAVSQVITYIPNPKDRTKKKTEYLLEFENEAVHMFQALLGVSEYLYRLRELSLMYDGKIPLMVQERANWPKKIGRNDPCPCGSGKNTNSVMGRIRVEAMKSHALADRARVETMATSILEKVLFHAGLRKTVDMFPLTNRLRRTRQKSDLFRCIRLDMFPRTNGTADIKMDVSSHVETVVLLSREAAAAGLN